MYNIFYSIVYIKITYILHHIYKLRLYFIGSFIAASRIEPRGSVMYELKEDTRVERDWCRRTGSARSSFDVRRSGLPAGDGRSFRVSFRSARVMCRRIMRWWALLMAVRWSWPVRHERVIRQGCRSSRRGLPFSKQVIKAETRLQIQRKLTLASNSKFTTVVIFSSKDTSRFASSILKYIFGLYYNIIWKRGDKIIILD